MKKENIVNFIEFLRNPQNAEVFYFEFPATRQFVQEIRQHMQKRDRGEVFSNGTKLYDYLGNKFKNDIDFLRQKVSFFTNPGEWWLEIGKPELNVDGLKLVILKDDNFYNRFSYMKDLIDRYRKREEEQIFNDIVFSFFSHSRTRKDFFQFFSGFTIGSDIEQKFGYAIG